MKRDYQKRELKRTKREKNENKNRKIKNKWIEGRFPFKPALFQRTEAGFPDRVHRWKLFSCS